MQIKLDKVVFCCQHGNSNGIVMLFSVKITHKFIKYGSTFMARTRQDMRFFHLPNNNNNSIKPNKYLHYYNCSNLLKNR